MRQATYPRPRLVVFTCLLVALGSLAFAFGQDKKSQASCGREELIRTQMNKLQDRDSDVSAQAASWLGALRAEDAVPALLACIRERPEVRGFATRALGQIGDERAIPELLRLLEAHPEDSSVTTAALTSIDQDWRKRPEVQAAYERYETRFRTRAVKTAGGRVETANEALAGAEVKGRWLWAMQELDPDRACAFFSTLVTANTVPDGFSWLYRPRPDCARAVIPSLINGLRQFRGSFSNAWDVLSALDKLEPDWRKAPAAENIAPDLMRWTADHPESIHLDAVIEILKAVGDPAAVPVLMKTAEEKQVSPKQRASAVSALAAIPGDEAKAALFELAKEEDPALSGPVLAALARLKDPTQIPRLKRIVIDKSIRMEDRVAAVRTLLELDPDSLDIVLGIIQDRSEQDYFRAGCVPLASATNRKECIPVLLEQVRSRSACPQAINALGDLKVQEAVPVLFQVLEMDDAHHLDESVATAIAKITGEEGTASLIQFGTEHPKTACAIAMSLALELGRQSPRILVESLSLLASDDVRDSSTKYELDSARETLLRLVAECPRTEAIPAVEALLKDDSARVRACADYALYKIKSR